MTERDEPSLEVLRREFEYRIRTAVTYGLGRGEHGDTADRDVAGWIDREIGAAMASLTVSQVIEAVRQEEREKAAQAESALRLDLDDRIKAHQMCSASLDRFRDVVCEVAGYAMNPGDDIALARLREMHGLAGPEPTRWRDFMTWADAQRDQINAAAADRVREQGKEQDRG